MDRVFLSKNEVNQYEMETNHFESRYSIDREQFKQATKVHTARGRNLSETFESFPRSFQIKDQPGTHDFSWVYFPENSH